MKSEPCAEQFNGLACHWLIKRTAAHSTTAVAIRPEPGFSLHECGPRNLTWSDIGHLSAWHTVLPRLWRCGLTCSSNARARKGQHTCSRSSNPGEATLTSPPRTRPLKRFKETRPRNDCCVPSATRRPSQQRFYCVEEMAQRRTAQPSILRMCSGNVTEIKINIVTALHT